MATRYAFNAEDSHCAKARVEGVNASYKDLINVCSNIRGWNAERAVVFLTEAAEGERPIRYYKYSKHRGHLHELGGKKGGWPVKTCRIVLDVLKNAMANAESKGFGPCRIVHVQANKQEIYNRMSPKGRRIRQDLETSFVELVLRERNGPNAGLGKKKAEGKKSESKPAESKKAEAVSKPVESKKVETEVKAVESKTAPVAPKVEAAAPAKAAAPVAAKN